MTDQQSSTALAAAKTYSEAWAAGEFDRLRDLLREDVVIALPNSGETPTPSFVFTGVDEAIGYLQFSYGTFEHLTFRDQEWVVSDDARYVYLHAVGDMVVKSTGQDYDNVYVLRFQVQDGRIVRVLEYTNPIIWNALGLG